MGSLPSPLLVLGPQNTVVIHTLACQYGNVPLAIPLPSLIPLRTNEFPHYCHFCGPTHQASLVKFSNFRTFCKMSTHDLPTHGYIYGYTLLPYWLTRWHLPILPLPLTTHYSSHFRHVWFLHSKVLSAYTMPSSSFYFSSSSRIVVLFVSKPLPHPTPPQMENGVWYLISWNTITSHLHFVEEEYTSGTQKKACGKLFTRNRTHCLSFLRLMVFTTSIMQGMMSWFRGNWSLFSLYPNAR